MISHCYILHEGFKVIHLENYSLHLEDRMEAKIYLAELEKALPPIVFRNWPRWKDIIPISPRTVANDDSRGIGPKEKIYLGRVAGYPKASFMAYLRTKTRIS